MQYHAWACAAASQQAHDPPHMGMREALRAGTELSMVNGLSEGDREFIDNFRELGLTAALSTPLLDGRTRR